ncbi:MAG: recombination mediator RecR [Flavobacteriales bacterium]
MQIPSKYLEQAAEQLATLPGIGKRTALRLALHLHRRDGNEIKTFVESLIQLKTQTFACQLCGNISDTETCSICANERRANDIICIVEDVRDIMAIESTETYKGKYHVLGGTISPMDGVGPQDLNIDTLVERSKNPAITEIIFALSPTMEGDTTNFYLFKRINREGLVITTLSRGVSIGSELQYADEITLGRSLQQRQVFKLNT